jgi:hypothetical protein
MRVASQRIIMYQVIVISVLNPQNSY